MGKIRRWLIGTAISTGVPIGLYFGLIHDTSKPKIEYHENYKMDNLLNDIFANCLDYTKDEGKIALSISDQGVNDAIYNATREDQMSAMLPDFYCKFNKGKYDFYLNIKSGTFIPMGTKINISTVLEEKIRSDYDNKSCFVFRFKDIKIGRLGGIKTVATSVLKNFITNEQIKEAMGDSIHCDVNIEKAEIVYPKENLASDIKSIISSGGDTGGIPFSSLLQAFFDNDLVHLNTEQEGTLRFDIDCKKFAENSEYVESYDLGLNDETRYNGLTLNKINEYLKSVLDANPTGEEYKENIFQFFMLGYENCPAEVKTQIDSLDFTCIGDTFDPKTHKGFNFEKSSLNDSAKSQVEALKSEGMEYFADSQGFNLINFTESDINAYLKTTDVIGYNFAISSSTTDEEGIKNYKTSYICVDNFYCNIYDETTTFVVGLNLNGYETSMILPTTLISEKSVANFATGKFNVTYELGNINFGGIEMPKDFTSDICTILTTVNNDAMTISRSGEKYYLTFDFSSAIKSSVDSTLSTMLSSCDFHFETKGANKEANGTLAIRGLYNSVI